MWTVETLNTTVDAELEALPEEMLANFWQIADLIKEMGLERVCGPYVDHLEGPLWEMRLKGRDGIARAIYVAAHRKRVVGGACLCQEDPEDAAT